MSETLFTLKTSEKEPDPIGYHINVDFPYQSYRKLQNYSLELKSEVFRLKMVKLVFRNSLNFKNK